MDLWPKRVSRRIFIVSRQLNRLYYICLKYICISHTRIYLSLKNLSVDNECECQIFNMPLYFTGIATCIYTEYARMLMETAYVAQSVDRWSRDPGSRLNSQPEALELHFSQLVPVGS